MQLTIERIDIKDIDYEGFVEKYLTLEKPVIISGVKNFDPKALTPQYIKQTFAKNELRSAGWFDSELPDNGDKVKVPDLVNQVMAREDMSLRKRPMRVFMQPKGHRTLPHYDGNSLHGFNLQITGEKKWILSSPNTPLPTVPFMFVGMVNRDFKVTSDQHDYYELTTKAGDLLFLPRYWFHEVYSIGKVNLNMNWVCTPVSPSVDSKLGRRECELLKVRSVFVFMNKLFPDKFSEYGGQGKVITDSYIKNISYFRVLTRCLKEISGIPKMLFLLKSIKSGANEFSENNFKITESTPVNSSE